MRSPTDVLRDEHVVILRALSVLESAAERLAAGRAFPAGWWEVAVGWLRAFADRNHHAKEENVLFPAMIKAGVPSAGGPIDVMLEEHEQGRALIAQMAEGASPHRAAATRRYVQLLREHIDKENGIVFPLAEAVVEETVMQDLSREFDTVVAELGATASLEGAQAAVARLAAALEPAPGGRPV
jgi:hemerythrin-like domain-containing protein